MFSRALPVYPSLYAKEMNVQVFFPIDFPREAGLCLRIAGENEYQIFLNGKLLGYGPAKAAHGYHRIDEYPLEDLKERNRLLIVLSGYNCYSFDRVFTPPFLCYELCQGKEVKQASSLESLCYHNEGRLQKVTRFSYQRNFSESYGKKLDGRWKEYGFYEGEPLALEQVEPGIFLPRRVSYPKFEEAPFALAEKNSFSLDPRKKIYDDRYMWNEKILVYKEKEWEVNPNRFVSLLTLEENPLPLSSHLSAYQSLAYVCKVSYTGFLRLRAKLSAPSAFYVHFDEYNASPIKGHIDFPFYRNTTHNIVSYSLEAGEYDLLTFLPYTAKYVRVSLERGEMDVMGLSLLRLENPDVKLAFSFEDERLNAVFFAAANTFRQNALDILTDCPSRERAGWLFDSYFTGRAESLFTGKSLVERNFLENYALYRAHGDVKEGMVPMCYPADFPEGTFIPNWSLWYGLELYAYAKRNGYDETVEESLPNLRGLISYFSGFENELGLLENLENWVFVEWSPANDEESIRGVNLPSNMTYARFLECAGELLGDPLLSQKAEAIREKIRSLGYDGHYFHDNLVRDEAGNLILNSRIGETTQYYAFYFLVATPATYPSLWETLKKEFGPHRDEANCHPEIYKSNVLPGDFLRLEMLLENGNSEQMLEECVDYFYRMAVVTGTLWEHDSVFASLNHGFTSYVAKLIVTAITGLVDIDYEHRIAFFGPSSYAKNCRLEIPVGEGSIIVTMDHGKRRIVASPDIQIREK